MLGEVLLGAVDQGIELVPGVDDLPALLVLVAVRLGVRDHALDLVLVDAAGTADRDLLLLARALVLGGDVHDAVRVDVERDLDLRQAPRRRRNAHQVETPQRPVVARHFALALQDMDLHGGLVVAGGRERLALARGNRCVAVDQLGEDAAQRLDAERQRRDVQQQNVRDVSRQHAALDRGADRHDLVRIHATVRFATEELLDRVLNRRHPGLAADHDDLLDVGGGKTRILERLTARPESALDQVLRDLLELAAGQPDVQVLGTRGVGGHEGQVDLGLLHAGKLDLGLLAGFLEALHGHRVLAQVDALVLLELRQQPVDDPLIDVVPPEVGVAVRRLHLDDALTDLQDRDVEGAAAEVVHGDRAVPLLVQAVRERRRGRLIDQPLDGEAGDLAGVAGRLTLGVVEVRRHGDHRTFDRTAQVVLRRLLQLLQHHRGDLRRGVALSRRLDLDVIARTRDRVGDHLLLFRDLGQAPSHEALDRENRVLRVRHRLPLGNLTDQALALVRERDDRRCRPASLRVRHHLRVRTLHQGDDAVRRPQVDSNDLAQVLASSSSAPSGASGCCIRWFAGGPVPGIGQPGIGPSAPTTLRPKRSHVKSRRAII